VYHTPIGADEASIGEEVMDRHVAHLGEHGVGRVATERVAALAATA
jgi:hypothetical protein